MLATNLHAQQSLYTLIKSYPCKGVTINLDQFGNAYVITENQELLKISPRQDKVFRYSLLKYGIPTTVDASNPLRILLHFKDFNIIAILDNTLSEKGVINLQDFGYFQIDAACTASDNHLWIYDGQNFRLKKIDDRNNVLVESEDFQLLFNQEIIPVYMVEADNNLYVSDPNLGILVFDLFGGYIKTIPITSIQKFQISRDQLIYYKNDQLMGFHLKTLGTYPINTPKPGNVKNMAIQDEYLGILLDIGLNLYAYKAQ